MNGGSMLHLILADSEMETVPREMWGHPSVRKHADNRKKRPGNLLLDASFHHQAIRSADPMEGGRRGRPDIAHVSLLTALGSPLNRAGLLRCYLHTRNNEVFFFRHDVNIPRAYHRFAGLMESVFQNGAAPDSESPLIWMTQGMPVVDLMGKISSGGRGPETFLLHPDGRLRIRDLDPVFSGLRERDVIVIIGGFPEGDFLSDLSSIPVDQRVSLGPDLYMACSVSMEIIAQAERAADLI